MASVSRNHVRQNCLSERQGTQGVHFQQLSIHIKWCIQTQCTLSPPGIIYKNVDLLQRNLKHTKMFIKFPTFIYFYLWKPKSDYFFTNQIMSGLACLKCFRIVSTASWWDSSFRTSNGKISTSSDCMP